MSHYHGASSESTLQKFANAKNVNLMQMVILITYIHPRNN